MAADMFLKIEGVEGESRDGNHAKEIDVLAWSWGMNQSGSFHAGGGGGAGKVNVSDLSFTKKVDKSTPVLMGMCCNGSQIKSALLTVRKAGGKEPLEYVKIKMENVIITSVASGGSNGDDQLTENISLNFQKVGYEYQPQKDDGTKDGGAVPMKWDIAQNKTY